MISPFPQSRQFHHHIDYLHLRSISATRKPIDEYFIDGPIRQLKFQIRHRGCEGRGGPAGAAAGKVARLQCPLQMARQSASIISITATGRIEENICAAHALFLFSALSCLVCGHQALDLACEM